MTIGVSNEIGDSSVGCQSYAAFVIEPESRARALAQTSCGMKITRESTDEPISTEIVRKLLVARVLFGNARRATAGLFAFSERKWQFFPNGR